jgi:hypothetical protein
MLVNPQLSPEQPLIFGAVNAISKSMMNQAVQRPSAMILVKESHWFAQWQV